MFIAVLILLLKELQNYNGKLFFVSASKMSKHFKTLFFKINLHFVTSNQKSTDRKLNLLLINSLLTYRNAKKTQTPKYT